MQVIKHNGWTLTDKDNCAVQVGQEVTDFRGDKSALKGGTSPAGLGKSGYVHTTDGAEYYATVFDLRWVRDEDGKFFGDGR